MIVFFLSFIHSLSAFAAHQTLAYRSSVSPNLWGGGEREETRNRSGEYPQSPPSRIEKCKFFAHSNAFLQFFFLSLLTTRGFGAPWGLFRGTCCLFWKYSQRVWRVPTAGFSVCPRSHRVFGGSPTTRSGVSMQCVMRLSTTKFWGWFRSRDTSDSRCGCLRLAGLHGLRDCVFWIVSASDLWEEKWVLEKAARFGREFPQQVLNLSWEKLFAEKGGTEVCEAYVLAEFIAEAKRAGKSLWLFFSR